MLKSALVVGLEVTIAFKASPAISSATFHWKKWRRTILDTGCTHQISSSCQIRFKLPFTRYTTSVLFSQSLDNLIVVALSRQPPIPSNALAKPFYETLHTFSAANLSFSANFCFKVIFFFTGAAPEGAGAAVFLGFSESDTSQSSFESVYRHR